MRGKNRFRLRRLRLAIGGSALVATLIFAVGSYSQEIIVKIVPRLTGGARPMQEIQAPPLARSVADDVRMMRNYPEQPPMIPHSIEGYQLTLNTNRCLDCHRRQFTEGSRAPMISVTHFMDRDGQVLADVTARRYNCTACHVPQTDAKPLVPNAFEDMLLIGKPKQ